MADTAHSGPSGARAGHAPGRTVVRAMTLQGAPITRQQAPPMHRFVPVAEAVRILGLSATTIRRKIDAGELEAERVARPQGTAFLVRVPADEPPRAEDAPRAPQEAPGTRRGRADRHRPADGRRRAAGGPDRRPPADRGAPGRPA